MKKKIFILTFIIFAFLFIGGVVKVNADTEILTTLNFNNWEDVNPPIISYVLPDFQIDSTQSDYVTDYSFGMYYKENEEYFEVENVLDFEGGKTYYLIGEFTLSEDVTIIDSTQIYWGLDGYSLAKLKEQSQVIIEGQNYKFNIPYTIPVSTPIDVLEVNIEKPTEGPVPDFMNNASFNYDGVEVLEEFFCVYDEDLKRWNDVEYMEYGDNYAMVLVISILNEDYIFDGNSKLSLWGNVYKIYNLNELDEAMDEEFNNYVDEVNTNGGVIASIEENPRLVFIEGFMGTLVKEYNINVTVNDSEQGTVTGSNLRYIKGEEDRILTITPNAGYMLDKVLVNDIDKTAEVENNQLTISSITEDKEVKVFFKKIIYEILEGEDLKTSDLSKLRFRIDADYSKFSTGGKVFVDDVELNNTQYTSKSGSTIIELAESFASTLSEGNHKIKVVFNDGAEVATNFTIEGAVVPSKEDGTQEEKEYEEKQEKEKEKEQEQEEEIANPKTGDKIAIYSTVCIVALLGITAFVGVNKRK